jgi:FkbM family methyltransferase
MKTKMPSSLSFTDTLNLDPEAKIAERFPPISRIFEPSTPAILYPAGLMARSAAETLQHMGVRLIGFGDSNPLLWGKPIDNFPVFSPQQIMLEFPDASILLASGMYDSEITEMLVSLGCKWIYPLPFLNHCLPEVFAAREYQNSFEEVTNPANHAKINQVYQLLADEESRRVFASKIEYMVTLDKRKLDQIFSTRPQYFDPEIIHLSDREVFVDCGAFTGDTLNEFLELSNGKFQAYHAFEPDPKNFADLQQIAAHDPQRIWAVQKGLAEKTGQLSFLKTSKVDARFVEGNDPSAELLSVVKLDEYFANLNKPTFIKMDIEGSEVSALRGAAQIIASNQPILAVSIYHFPGDLWNIPYLIHQFNPGYRLFIRHYAREIVETVCYALPVGR